MRSRRTRRTSTRVVSRRASQEWVNTTPRRGGGYYMGLWYCRNRCLRVASDPAAFNVESSEESDSESNGGTAVDEEAVDEEAVEELALQIKGKGKGKGKAPEFRPFSGKGHRLDDM